MKYRKNLSEKSVFPSKIPKTQKHCKNSTKISNIPQKFHKNSEKFRKLLPKKKLVVNHLGTLNSSFRSSLINVYGVSRTSKVRDSSDIMRFVIRIF